MQLLKITVNPMEFELKIEKPKLEANQHQQQPTVVRETSPASLEIHSRSTSVRMDTIDMRNSAGIRSSSEFSSDAARRGKEAVSNKTAEYAEIGFQLSQVQGGPNISDISAQTFYPNMPMIETTFLPSVGPNISWEPGSISVEYNPGKLTNDWNIMKNTMEYIPGKIFMEITKYPSITIEYLGEPIYAPPSANPNYEEK